MPHRLHVVYRNQRKSYNYFSKITEKTLEKLFWEEICVHEWELKLDVYWSWYWQFRFEICLCYYTRSTVKWSLWNYELSACQSITVLERVHYITLMELVFRIFIWVHSHVPTFVRYASLSEVNWTVYVRRGF